MKDSKRIVLATIGSLGDLHPCLALATELGLRRHKVVIASTEYYRNRVEDLGIEFRSLRPNWDPTDKNLIRKCQDIQRGPEVLYRELILPALKDTYDDLLDAVAGSDFMIAGELVYAAPLVAEKISVHWASVILSPFSFFSSYDPSYLVNLPQLIHLRKLGWRAYRAGLNLCRFSTRHWSNPVRTLRRELRLRVACDPVFSDKFSPDLVLALFSPEFARPQPDRPGSTIQPGFVYHEQPSAGIARDLEMFLASGDAPILFTQGSTAVHNPGRFYETSIEAAGKIGRRAVLLGTKDDIALRTSEVIALPYAPYSKMFPRSAINVHQGGSGTTGEALRAGRPMLIVPYGWDQPDNAARVERLGCGLHLSRADYTADSAAQALERLLSEPTFESSAQRIGERVRKEDGLNLACDAIESVL